MLALWVTAPQAGQRVCSHRQTSCTACSSARAGEQDGECQALEWLQEDVARLLLLPTALLSHGQKMVVGTAQLGQARGAVMPTAVSPLDSS